MVPPIRPTRFSGHRLTFLPVTVKTPRLKIVPNVISSEVGVGVSILWTPLRVRAADSQTVLTSQYPFAPSAFVTQAVGPAPTRTAGAQGVGTGAHPRGTRR
jgi:hypothetical protein